MTDTFRDEPRSWPQLLVDGVRGHAAGLWFVAFLFFASIVALDAVVLAYINGVPIETLAQAEARTGTSLAAEVHRPGLYLQVGLHLAAALATLHSWLQAR